MLNMTRPAPDRSPSDADLVARYVRDRSAEAFRALVDRHAGMVHAVCLRGLGRDAALAEDAAQAVFLVLARKAGSIRDPGALAGWLFQIARMVVLRLRRQEAARRRRESATAATREGRPPMMDRDRLWEQAKPHLDEAIASLRETHRAAIVLYFLEGIRQEDMARRLGCAQSTVHERIAGALEHLRRFLLRKGVAIPAASLAAGLTALAAPAAPAAVAAACAAAGTAGATGSAAASAAQGSLQALLVAKVKVAAALVVVASVTAGGAGMAVWPEEKPRAAPAAAATPKESDSPGPLVFWHSQPVRPGETLMLAGARFDPGTVIEADSLPDADPARPSGAAPSDKGIGWQRLPPVQLTPQLAQVVLPAGRDGVWICRARNGGATGPVRLVNAPDAWFAQGDQGETASPGGWIGVFGTCIAMTSAPAIPGPRSEPAKKGAEPAKAAPSGAGGGGPVSRLALVANGQTVRVLKARVSGGTRFGQYFDLPADCPAGTFELFVHNGCGGPQAWTRLADRYNERPITSITVAPRAVWPEGGADVSQQPGATDDERFAAALKACRNGGTILVPAGTYKLRQPLVLPHLATLRGAGAEKTRIEWVESPADGRGRCLPLIRGADLPKPAGIDRRASFSIEDLSLTAAPGYMGNLIERAHTSVPARFRRVTARVPRLAYEGVKRETEGIVLHLDHARNTEIAACDWDAFTILIAQKEVSHLRCTDTRFRWRDLYVWLMRNHNNILFEHNRATLAGTFASNGFTEAMNPNPGFSYAGYDNSNCRNLYFAHNLTDREETEPPHRSIGLTFDGATTVYAGRIRSVDGTKLLLAGPTIGPDRYNHPPCDPGASVRIVSGRGAGQWRYLASRPTTAVTEIEVDRPWDVEPDKESWIAVSNVLGRTLFVGNTFSSNALLQTYFGTEDVVFAENAIGVPGQRVAMPVWADAGRNAWHYQVLDNRVGEQGLTADSPQPNWDKAAGYAGPITGTHVYRNNRAADPAARFVIRIPSRSIGFLLERNQGMAAIETRNVKDALGVVRQNTDLKGALLKPEGSLGPSIVVAP